MKLPFRVPRVLTWAVGIIVTMGLVTAALTQAAGSAQNSDLRTRLTVVAPAAAGGGWDLVARETQRALRTPGGDSGTELPAMVNNVQVVNVPGAGGTIGLSQLERLTGDAGTVMVTGTVMMGSIVRNKSTFTLADTTPIARLAEDFEVIAVPRDSEFKTLDDLLRKWREDPAALPIGGGSAGGIDHMVAAQLARSADIDPARIVYSAYSGGGELTLSLLSPQAGTVDVGISGYNDFRDLLEGGDLRALAVVAPERLPNTDIPTMIELGYPEVDLVNWRGIVAPPGVTPEERTELIRITEEMIATPAWRSAVERNRWKDSYLSGDQFGAFLADEQARIDGLLRDLGLA
ncbi:putative tricarboxylic transport membrane protein [Enemella evansiae]|nr:putative tricarboxylic transport membrane protein [Enemella evansiae]